MSAMPKEEVARKIWLGYFNRILYEKGLISELERNKMALKIALSGTAQKPTKCSKDS